MTLLQRLIEQHAATKDELAANDVELAKAQAEVTRLTAVKQQFDRSVTLDASSAPLAVQQAQSEVAALEEKVRNGRIVAPSDGTLYSLPVKTGDYVHLGDLLAEMADLSKVRVRVFIDEPELGALAPNEPVRITWDALPNRVWNGKTETVPKQVVARGSRSVGELLCTVDNDKLELLPNINVNVRINSKERDNVLAVPRGSVEGEGSKRYVYVVKRGELGKTQARAPRDSGWHRRFDQLRSRLRFEGRRNGRAARRCRAQGCNARAHHEHRRQRSSSSPGRQLMCPSVRLARRIATVIAASCLSCCVSVRASSPIPRPRPGDSIESARQAYEISDYPKAVQLLQEAASKDPQKSRNFSAAHQELQRAATTRPGDRQR